jgi:hypothetical protein
VLKGGGNELGRRLRRVDIADTRLRIPLQFAKCYANTFAVRRTKISFLLDGTHSLSIQMFPFINVRDVAVGAGKRGIQRDNFLYCSMDWS